MGNKLDITAWWYAKLRDVRRKMAAWRSTGHLSLTARNLLLQAIVYGSTRYWLFSLCVPASQFIVEGSGGLTGGVNWAFKKRLQTSISGCATLPWC